MYIRRVKNLEENSKIGNEIIFSLKDAILQEAKKKKKRQQSALSPFCYLGREEKKKEPEVIKDAGNVEQGIEFFNSTFNGGDTNISTGENTSASLGEAKEHLKPVEKGATFIRTKEFDSSAKKLKMTEEDIEDLQETICSVSPEANLGANVYKIRFAPKSFSKGKSTSYRNLYFHKNKGKPVYLLFMYTKTNQSDLDPKEKEAFKKLAKSLDKEGK